MWNITNGLYKYYIEENQDPRANDFLLMDSPRTSLILVAMYLIFVKIIGPWYMRDRPAFNIRSWIIAYNAFMTLFSLYIFVFGIYYSFYSGFNILCETQDYNDRSYYKMKLLSISWWFFIGRFIEFIDTIFFILRKKNNHVSTLHVVHHAVVPLIVWMGFKLTPGGHNNFTGGINSFVHIFMYLYYMIAAMGTEYRKYLWWKKYMTILQLVQFVMVIIHTLWTLATGCAVPKVFGYLILIQAMFFYKMFWNFYKEAFNKPGNHSKQEEKSSKMEQFVQKNKQFLEMCVPNQHLLMSDADTGREIGEENSFIEESLKKIE